MSSKVDELDAVRQQAQEILRQFNVKRSAIKNCTKAPNLNVTGVLQKVLALSECIGSTCLKDAEAYIEHSKYLTNGTADAALSKISDLTSAAYTEIKQREDSLKKELDAIQDVEESLNDFVARAERIEKNIAPIRAAVDKERLAVGTSLQKARIDAENAKLEVGKARAAYENAENNYAEKRRVNKDLISGLGDWFTRSDDKFDLLYSLGVDSEQADNADRVVISGYAYLLNAAEDNVTSAKDRVKEFRKSSKKAGKTLRVLGTTLDEMHGLKGPAVEAVKTLEDLESAIAKISVAMTDVENALESCKGQRTLPTIEEMCKKLLAVVVAVGHYSTFEKGLSDINRSIFRNVDKLVNFPELIENEDDDDLKTEYEEATKLAG